MKYRSYIIALALLLIFLLYWGCSGSKASGANPIIPPGSGDGFSVDFTIDQRGSEALTGSPIVIKTAPNMVKIKRDMDISAFAESVNIKAGRNEHEPFQVIPVPGSVTSLTGVQVGISDLVNAKGGIFTRNNFTFYLEGYVFCSTVSDAGGGIGWFPDPLVPITMPFEVRKTVGNQPVWVDCYVPSGTAPGVYNGNVVVTALGGLMKSIPIQLKVLNFTIGDEFQLKTAFGLNREVINSYHGYPAGYNSPEVDALREKYADVLLARGISTWGIDWFKPSYRVNADNTVSVDFSTVEARINKYLMGGKPMTTFQFSLRAWDLLEGPLTVGAAPGSQTWRKRVKSYVQECSKYFENRGLLDKSFVFIIDEPNSATDYANIRFIADLLREANPRPKFMVTEQAYSWNYTNWGSILGYVDIFCPHVTLVEPEGKVYPSDPYNTWTGQYETWTYTNTNVHPFLGYAIDHPAVEPRLLAWLCYREGITGMLYWSVNYWKMANPWDNPYTLGTPLYGAGNGSLIYPGMDASECTGQPDQEAPVVSIRLEQIREGLEDYEYLMAIGGGNHIPLTDLIITGYKDYTTDGNKFYKLRNIGLEIYFGS